MRGKRRRVLVTGSAGLLGSKMCAHFSADSHVVGFYHRQEPVVPVPEAYRVDLRDEFAVRQALTRSHPDLVIHCAGIVNVDDAEGDYDRVREVNAIGTRVLARHVAGNATFVYISTDSLFDGSGGPYSESDVVCPLNDYAKSKLEGEWFVQQEAKDHLIVRTNFFGLKSGGGTFADWLHDSLSQRLPMRMVVDWRFSPMYVADLVRAVDQLVDAGMRGIVNVASSEACSKYEFALAFAEEFGFDTSRIDPVHFSQMSFHARRPQDMSLDVSKAAEALGRDLPTYRDGLKRMHEAMLDAAASRFDPETVPTSTAAGGPR